MDDVVYQDNVLCPIIFLYIWYQENPQIERFYVFTGWRNTSVLDFTLWRNMGMI